jgi:hypothetical protein
MGGITGITGNGGIGEISGDARSIAALAIVQEVRPSSAATF